MISRRDFLKATGITLFATQIPGFIPETRITTPKFEPLYGRVLKGFDGLWTDSIMPITKTLPNGYQTPHGVIEKYRLQPMLSPVSYQQASYEPPFVAEVIGASAVLRRYCGDMVPRYRLGHGGLLNVQDRIHYDGVDWYGVDDLGVNPQLFWTHSAPLAPVTIPPSVQNLTLEFHRATYTLTALQDEQPLFSVPFAAGDTLIRGEYAVTKQTPISKTLIYIRMLPFVTTFGDDLHIYGAYWHNNFGNFTPDEGIQVPPYVAKWIYGASANGARVIIV